MFCANCGKSFDGESTLCPECAAAKAAANAAPAAPQATQLPPVFEAEAPQNSLAQEAPVSQNSLAQNAPEQASAPAEEPDYGYEPFAVSAPAPAPEKKKFNFKLAGIIAAVVALVGGALFFFFGTDRGKYMTSSPEEYLQEVQQEQVSTYIDTATSLYGAFLDAESTDSFGASSELRVQVGDALLDMAASSGVPVDQLKFLKDIRLSFDTNSVTNTMQNKIGLSLGENEILQLDTIMDMMTSRVYLALPALSSQYLSAALPTAGNINMAQAQMVMTKLREELPSENDVNKMLHTFTEVALAQILNVEKGEETVAVGGVSEKQHVLTATVTEADVLRMAIAVLEEAQKNETFKELVNSLNTAVNMMGAGVDLNSEIMTQLPRAIAQLNTMVGSTSGTTVVVKTYVNHSGEITGRVVTLFSNGPAEEVLRYLSATDDGVTQTEGTIGLYHFTGHKQTTGKTTSGKYTFSVDSNEMFTLEVIEIEGQSTEFRVSPGKDLMNNLLAMAGAQQENSEAGIGAAMSPIAGLMAGSMSVSLTVNDPDSDNPGIAVSAQVGGQNLFTISLISKKNDSNSVTVPQTYVDAEDAEAVEAWLNSLDFTGIINKLRAAGVPEELLSQLEGMISGYSSVQEEAVPAA